MNPEVVAVCAVVGALGGLLVPRVIRALPEPETSEAAPGEDPKPLYVDVGSRTGLAWRAALASGVLAAVVGAILAIVGVLGWGLAVLAAVVAVICAILFRRTTG